jgi:hypothetical protein
MSEQYGCKVSDLLPDTFDHLDEVIKESLDSGSEEARPNIPSFAWKIIQSKAAQAVRGVLDGDVFELLARAWCVARELHEFTDRRKYPPGKDSTVFLGKHQVSTEVHPVLVMTVGSIEGPRLRFTLTLTAHFRSAALSIRDGHITAIDAGDCSVGAQLKYKEIKLHKELESREVKLPGRLQLQPPGLEIG